MLAYITACAASQALLLAAAVLDSVISSSDANSSKLLGLHLSRVFCQLPAMNSNLHVLCTPAASAWLACDPLGQVFNLYMFEQPQLCRQATFLSPDLNIDVSFPAGFCMQLRVSTSKLCRQQQ